MSTWKKNWVTWGLLTLLGEGVVLYISMSDASKEQIWTFIDHYRELIVNSLDLVSFVLVTPELLKIARPTMENIPIYTYHICIFIISLFVPLVILTFHIPSNINSMIFNHLIVFWFLSFIIISMLLGVLGAEDVVNKVGQIFSRSAFIVGVAAFFVSRSVALVAAIHCAINFKN